MNQYNGQRCATRCIGFVVRNRDHAAGCLPDEFEVREWHWRMPAPPSPTPSTVDICLLPINRKFLNRHHIITKFWEAGNWFASQEKPSNFLKSQSLLPGLPDLRIVIAIIRLSPLHPLLSGLFTDDLCIIICFHLSVTSGTFLFSDFPAQTLHSRLFCQCMLHLPSITNLFQITFIIF